MENKDALKGLENELDEKGYGFENWTQNIRYVCRQCSEGTPHEHHQWQERTDNLNVFQIAMAATSESKLKKMLNAWLSETNSELIDFQKIM